MAKTRKFHFKSDRKTRKRGGASSGELIKAVEDGNTEQVKALLDVDNISTKDEHGASLLYIASEKGHTEVVQLLLDNYANIDEQRNDGSSPLYIASQQGHEDVVKLLLDEGAFVSKKLIANAYRFSLKIKTLLAHYIPELKLPEDVKTITTQYNLYPRTEKTNMFIKNIPQGTIVHESTDYEDHAETILGKKLCRFFNRDYIEESINTKADFLIALFNTSNNDLIVFATLVIKYNHIYVDFICSDKNRYTGGGSSMMNYIYSLASLNNMTKVSLNSVKTSTEFYEKMI